MHKVSRTVLVGLVDADAFALPLDTVQFNDDTSELWVCRSSTRYCTWQSLAVRQRQRGHCRVVGSRRL